RCEVGGAAEPPPAAPAAVPAPAHRSAEVQAEEEMLAEAAEADSSDAPRRDPEEVALELLQSELGARKIDS
ncbi:MAG TPA: DNA polymerase III subunit gamma/tau, partial [Mycobacterium sp.]|nr:DNA polymerase III subunit gamma/tau [Mycobacterium sp.]